MSELTIGGAAVQCASCHTQIAPGLLVCPACHRLVHRQRLESLAREAEAAASANDLPRAITSWREALTLLPAASKQYEAIVARIDAATAAIEGKSVEEIRKGPPPGSAWAKVLGPLGVAGLLIWKFKFLVVAALTKAKFLLVGLTKMGTIGTMFLSFGVYWRAWGWQYAAALIAGIYIHEMGHVNELRRRGMPASAPMFVPGVGAFVRLKQNAATPAEDARIGLAGPLWGLGVAIVTMIVAIGTGSKFWLAVTHSTAVINLFNLTPVWQLDGSRAFSALTRVQRCIAVAAVFVAFALARDGILLIVGLVGAVRIFGKDFPAKNDHGALALFVAIMAALSFLAWRAG